MTARPKSPPPVAKLAPGGVALLAALCASAAHPLITRAQLPPDNPFAPAPASRPAAAARNFAEGVQIDWAQRRVIVDTQVCLREGALEFFACFAGKEHESILRMNAPAVRVYQALGLVGVSPGRAAAWDEATGRYAAPSGDLVDLEVQWGDGAAARTESAWSWVIESEYARSPAARPWVFTGSERLPDGGLAADRSGAGVALVNMPDALLALTRSHTLADAELWTLANTRAIPPVGTPVRLVLRPATAQTRLAWIDERGDLYIDHRLRSPADFADLLKLNQQLTPGARQVVEVRGALRADVARIRRALSDAGAPAAAVTWQVAR